MKRTLTISVLLLLFAGGCGYSSEDECRLKEMQQCDSSNCETQAYLYCSEEFRGDSWVSTLFDWILTIGFWGLMLLGVGGIIGLVIMSFSSDSEERKEGWTVLFFISIGGLVFFLFFLFKDNYL